MVRAAIALICVQLAGCSLGIQGPAKGLGPAEVPHCDTGRGAVFADGVLAATAGVGGLATMGDSTGLGIGLLALATLVGVSAMKGNRNATACEQAMRSHDLYVAAMDRQRERPGLPPGIEEESDADAAQRMAAATRAAVPAPAVAAAAPPMPDPDQGDEAEQEPGTGTGTAKVPAPRDWAEFWELVP